MKNIWKLFAVIITVLVFSSCASVDRKWEEAKAINSIDSYNEFIKEYPKTPFADSALVSMGKIYESSIKDVVQEVIPNAKLEVDLKKLYSKKPEFIIFEHLLENRSSEDVDPHVEGDYDTNEKLERLVKDRIAKVLKAVISKALIPSGCIISVEIRHGVRMLDPVTKEKIKDEAMTLFKINVSEEKAKQFDWEHEDTQEIINLWEVKENIIPDLIIGPM